MTVHDYHTAGGKNVILEYIQDLPARERAEAMAIREVIQTDGIDAFEFLSTRQLYKKLYEVKFSQERMMYIIANSDNIFFVHICKKEKRKAKTKDLDLAKNAQKNGACFRR